MKAGPTRSSSTSSTNSTNSTNSTWGAIALLTIVTLAAYWPALTASFVWDDDVMLTNNPLVKAADGLYRMWFTKQAIDYWPLTGTSLWLEWRLWGANAAGYHATNVALHVANAVLAWKILRRLQIPGALLAALLFAVHPVNVESVAWIAERKNTLSLLFFLLSVLWYLRLDEQDWRSRPEGRPLRTWYWLSLSAFILAMLSKGSVAVLPAILLLIAWWRRGSIGRLDIVRTLPFFAVAALLTAVNIWFQARSAAGVIRHVSVLERVLGAAGVVWFYLYKALLPIKLIFVYPQWAIRASDWRWWVPLAAALCVTGVLVGRRRQPACRDLLFAWMFFCLALVPVMGLTDVYFMRFSLVADHYQYIALLAVVAAVAAGLSRVTGRLNGRTVQAMAGAVVVVLGLLTWHHASLYADSETLFLSILKDNPGAWLAHNNLATMYLHQSPPNPVLAISHLRAAVGTNPEEASLHNNLGTAFFQNGEFEAASAQHREAIRLQTDYADAYVGLGDDLQSLGRYAEAVAAYRRALAIDPELGPVLRANLGRALQASGQGEQAARELEQAVASNAGSAKDFGASADALLHLGRTEAAIAQYQEALRHDPSSVHVLNNLGYALTLVGRLGEAEAPLRRALRIQPDFAGAHDNLGNVLRQTGRIVEATQEFNTALKEGSGPELAQIHNDLGIALAQQGQLEEAIGHFREALRLNPNFPAASANLARALRSR